MLFGETADRPGATGLPFAQNCINGGAADSMPAFFLTIYFAM